MEEQLGLVHVYTGEGKGKTSASLGLALRAIGHGYRVYMVQFLKGGMYTGEVVAAQSFLQNLTIAQFGKGCLKLNKQMRMDGGKPPIFVRSSECGDCRYCFLDNDANRAREALRQAKKRASSGDYDIVILDEVNVAVHHGLLPVEEVITVVKEKAPHTELVLTGRNAPQEVMDAADYVSEVKAVKHPFSKGILARKGIEY
ncbi:MAG: cob(I)yrinic acid a,c-diamide adenosyltransferase [Nanoarchaeota archaeon]